MSSVVVIGGTAGIGREIAQHQDYSEDTAIKIDQEVQRLIIEQYNRARQIIVENKDALVRLAEALLERESLDSVQIRSLIAGLPLARALSKAGPNSSVALTVSPWPP